MIVEELIKYLSKHDPKATVVIETYDVYDLCSVMAEELDGKPTVFLVAEDE